MGHQMLQILTPRGELVGDPPVDLDRAADLYREMVLARTYDKKGITMQKQGRLATYAPFEGQEAAQVGSAVTLEPDDWMVPAYREPAAMWIHGYPMELLIATRRGTELGGSPPSSVNVLPVSIPVGSHMLHAVGVAWASKFKGTNQVAITYFGDGATSEGDFHEAMNFAGVFRAGCVFFCQNNGWAISLPRAEQTAAETIAQKADAYGMPGVLVDGNDVFAVYAATRDAVARARAGEGPTLIEALTYRMGPHSTADDVTRYRDAEETARWRDRDPLDRLRAYLTAQGRWTQEWQDELERTSSEKVEQAVAAAERYQPFTAAETFDGMFAELPEILMEQRALAEEL